jgi:hypothetical protein
MYSSVMVKLHCILALSKINRCFLDFIGLRAEVGVEKGTHPSPRTAPVDDGIAIFEVLKLWV